LILPADSTADETSLFHYQFSFSLPIIGEQEKAFNYANGTVSTRAAAANANAGEEGEESAEAEEEGEAKEGEGEKTDTLVIEWSSEDETIFLLPESAATIVQRLKEMGEHPWEGELVRVPKTEGTKDPNKNLFHGKVLLAMDPLVAVDATDADVLCSVLPWDGAAFEVEGSEAAPPAKKGGKAPAIPEVEAIEIEEGQEHPFVGAGTALRLQLRTERPLNPRPPTPKKLLRPSDLIPHQPIPARMVAEPKPVDAFRLQIRQVVQVLAESYQQLEGNGNLSGMQQGRDADNGSGANGSNAEEVKERVMYELNASGKYFAFKEMLKRSVVRIVREYYPESVASWQRGNPPDEVYGEIYALLVREIQLECNGLPQEGPLRGGGGGGRGDADPTSLGMEELLLLSQEQELSLNYARAVTLLQDRLTRHQGNAQLWYDYGELRLRAGEAEAAEECFRQAIGFEPTHKLALMALGSLLALREQFEDAEVFLRAASECEPASAELPGGQAGEEPNPPQAFLAWTLRALFLDLVELPKEARPCWKLVNKVMSAWREGAEKKREAALSNPDLSKREKEALQARDESGEVLLLLSEWLMECRLLPLAERALSMYLLQQGRTYAVTTALGRLYLLRSDWQRSEENLKEAMAMAPKKGGIEARRLLGHLTFQQSRSEDAISCYEKVLAAGPSTDLAVYARLGRIYLEQGEDDQASECFLSSVRDVRPTSLAWLGAGIAFYRKEQYERADQALAQANRLDPFSADIWAYCALNAMRAEKEEAADQALREAFKIGIEDGAVLRELGNVYLRAGRFRVAEGCLKRALALDAYDTIALRLLADAYIDHKNGVEAVACLQKLLDIVEEEGERQDTLQQLQRLCSELHRAEEADHYAKMLAAGK
jgi:tetratricopeptide (TPR) repeat protein